MIKLENVYKSYKHQNQIVDILENINLHIKESEIFGLVGSTGSGKTTLLRIMNGFLTTDSGNVYILNQKLTNNNKNHLVKETSMIFQDFNLLANLNVIENVLLAAKIRGVDKKLAYNKALKLLDFVGLKSYKDVYIKTLSGGQKQRVAIARSLMNDPKIIFCDEPTSALDTNMTNEILQLLKNINQQLKTTIVIISHDIKVIKAICNQAAILENKNIVDIVKIKNESIKNISYLEALES